MTIANGFLTFSSESPGFFLVDNWFAAGGVEHDPIFRSRPGG
jgi:hypothetical protein